jgi:hypothetical protein
MFTVDKAAPCISLKISTKVISMVVLGVGKYLVPPTVELYTSLR